MPTKQIGYDVKGSLDSVRTLTQAVGELKQAVEAVASIFGGRFTNVAQNISNIAQQAPMMTPTGQRETVSFKDAAQQLKTISQQYDKDPGSFILTGPTVNRYVANAAGNQLKEVSIGGRPVPVSALTAFREAQTFGERKAAINALPAFVSSETGRAAQLVSATGQPIQSEAAARAKITQSFMPNYSQSDIVRAQATLPDMGGVSDSVTKTLGSLRDTQDTGLRAIAVVLKGLQGDFKNNQEAFVDALGKLDLTKEEGKQELARLASVLLESGQQLKDASKAAGFGGKPPPSGPDFSSIQRISGWGKGIAAAIGLGVAGASLYQSGMLGLEKATYGKEAQTYQNIGSIGEQAFRMTTEARDMRTAENILRYRADMALPGQNFQFIGTRGISRSFDAASRQIDQQIEIMRRQRMNDLTQAGGTIVGGMSTTIASAIGLGLLGAAAGGPAGAGVGIGVGLLAPAIVGGIGQMMSGGQGAIGAYLGSEYTALTGGLSGDSNRSKMAQLSVQTRLNNEKMALARRLQDDELRATQQANLVAVSEWRNMVSARQRGVSLVGRYALTERGLLAGEEYTGSAFQPAADRMADEIRRGSDSQFFSPGLGRYYAEFASSGKPGLAKYGLMGLIRSSDQLAAPPNRDSVASAAQFRANKLIEQQAFADTTAAHLGISGAELMTHQQDLTQVLSGRRGASIAETRLAVQYGRSGLGSFEQILGNLVGVSRAGAGGDQFAQLNRVFSESIAAGFDKSRVAQQFVTSTTELATSIGATDLKDIAENLRTAASTLSGTGFATGFAAPDERGLALAARGMAGYHEYTRQTGGIPGALKWMGAFAAGATPTAALITSQMSEPQMSNYLSQLKSSGPLAAETRYLIDAMGGGEGGREGAARVLKGSYSASSYVLRGFMDRNAKGKVDLVQAKESERVLQFSGIDELYRAEKRAQDEKRFKDQKIIHDRISSIAAGAASAMNIDFAAGVQGSDLIGKTEYGIRQRNAAGLAEKQKTEAQKMYDDPAQINYRKYIDGLLGNFHENTNFGKLAAGNAEAALKIYKDTMKGVDKVGGMFLPTLKSKGLEGFPLSPENIDLLNSIKAGTKVDFQFGGKTITADAAKLALEEAGTIISDTNAMDIAIATERTSALAGGAQKVVIENVTQLGDAISTSIRLQGPLPVSRGGVN